MAAILWFQSRQFYRSTDSIGFSATLPLVARTLVLPLIESFKEKAVKGHIATSKEIKIAYEQKIGFPVDKTTIYRLLERHQWRKIVPRPSHPKEEPKSIEEFKKTLLFS